MLTENGNGHPRPASWLRVALVVVALVFASGLGGLGATVIVVADVREDLDQARMADEARNQILDEMRETSELVRCVIGLAIVSAEFDPKQVREGFCGLTAGQVEQLILDALDAPDRSGTPP